MRQPIGFANYRGDCVATWQRHIEAGNAFGPNYMGELMWPVSASHDPEADLTRVGFSLLAPEVSR